MVLYSAVLPDCRTARRDAYQQERASVFVCICKQLMFYLCLFLCPPLHCPPLRCPLFTVHCPLPTPHSRPSFCPVLDHPSCQDRLSSCIIEQVKPHKHPSRLDRPDRLDRSDRPHRPRRPRLGRRSAVPASVRGRPADVVPVASEDAFCAERDPYVYRCECWCWWC